MAIAPDSDLLILDSPISISVRWLDIRLPGCRSHIHCEDRPAIWESLVPSAV
jgi:hypothetical protein